MQGSLHESSVHVNLSFKDDSTDVEIAETEATDSGVVEDQMADPDEDDADDGGVVLEETEDDDDDDEATVEVEEEEEEEEGDEKRGIIDSLFSLFRGS